MNLAGVLGHDAAVERMLAGPTTGSARTPAPPDWLRRSWQRSVERHRLEPGRTQRRFVVTPRELRQATDDAETLLRSARPHVMQLFQQLAAARHGVLLGDAAGVALEVHADGELAQILAGAAVRAGSVWREDFEGTCGIGTALAERMPVLVHRDQHFRLANVSMSCSAVPIFDADERLLGVLDASTLGVAQPPDGARTLVFALVRQTALAIENDLVAAQYGDTHWRLHLGPQPQAPSPAQERVLCVDAAGLVVGANRLARQTLLAGRQGRVPLQSLFDSRAEALFAAARAAPGLAMPLHALADGTRWWCTCRAPCARPAASARQAATTPAGDALARLGADDPGMRGVTDIARRVADKRLPILLEGETGSGKEVLARAIHASSARRDKPFVAMNCAAIPATLIESELYGHVDGAFTGARARGARGKLVQSSGGTLFLDEIGDMPLALQSRLLRVLAEQEVVPLGSDAPVPVELHVLCASHRDLAALVREGRFREDLYYRLGGVVLTLPPLRERSDLERLIDRLLREECEALGRSVPRLDAAARRQLRACRWPGNLRQLRHVLRYACAVCDGDEIGLDALPHPLHGAVAPATAPTTRCDADAGDDADAGFAPAAGPTRGARLDAALADRMRQALQACGGHAGEAAARLGIPRSTFYRKLRALGLGGAAGAAAEPGATTGANPHG